MFYIWALFLYISIKISCILHILQIPCLMVLRMISLLRLIYRLHQQVGKCIEWAGCEVLPDQVMWERNSLVEIRCLFYTVRQISSWKRTPFFKIWCCVLGTLDGRNPAPPGMYKTLYINHGINYQPQLVNAGFLSINRMKNNLQCSSHKKPLVVNNHFPLRLSTFSNS